MIGIIANTGEAFITKLYLPVSDGRVQGLMPDFSPGPDVLGGITFTVMAINPHH